MDNLPIAKFEKMIPANTVNSMIQAANSLELKSPEDFREAANILSATASYAEIVDQFWKPLEEAAYAAYKKLKTIADKFREVFSQDSKFKDGENNIRGIIERKILAVGYIPPGTDHIHIRTTHEAEVTDFEALVKACAKGKAPLELLQPNMSALNKLVSAVQSQIPGVKVKEKKTLVVRKMV